MGVWVRTQDSKTLIYAVHIYVDQPVNGDQICGISGLDSFIVLGKYSSQERALQILDEVQGHIWESVRAVTFPNDGYVAPIYTMPAE